MQSTGHGSRHFSQPEHSSGMMITSIPWLKIAPNCGGQWRRHVSQLMQIDMSILKGAFCHFGLRSRLSNRSSLVAAPIRANVAGDRRHVDPRVKSVVDFPHMSDTRQLTAQGLERKQQLLDHAARLFAERGYADTRIVDICKAAGVAKGL